MPHVRRKGQMARYWVARTICLGCSCFQPGEYQHRGAIGGGSKNSGTSLVCMRNAYHGCPGDLPVFSLKLQREREREGWVTT